MEVVGSNRKSDQWLGQHLPKMIDINRERTRELANHVLQEGYDVVSGPPGMMGLRILLEDPDSLGFLGGISKRGEN